MPSDIEIEFDPLKDAKNLAKHRMSLAEAEGFDWNSAHIEEDLRFISVRKANEREIKIYANSN